ncbi:MAG: precorrin-6Y C5,15-methyltransferase (decarboxylating) subunit CbiT, partial [Cyanobacteria bacterium J06641_5]
IAQAVRELKPPVGYRLWVCSALGSVAETVTEIDLQAKENERFSEPNVVVLQAQKRLASTKQLPLFGIPDAEFHTFVDRPGLLTKQEVRMLSLGLLQLQPGAIVWDIGAGTGSISVEIARLVPSGKIYAIERTAAGLALIRENINRFEVSNLEAIAGSAPEALESLPDPHRIVIGGGGAKKIVEILQTCTARLRPGGVLVAHFATLETCTMARSLLAQLGWAVQLLQVNLARSSPLPTRVGTPATRFVPLNPVTLLQAVEPNGRIQ